MNWLAVVVVAFAAFGVLSAIFFAICWVNEKLDDQRRSKIDYSQLRARQQAQAEASLKIKTDAWRSQFPGFTLVEAEYDYREYGMPHTNNWDMDEQRVVEELHQLCGSKVFFRPLDIKGCTDLSFQVLIAFESSDDALMFLLRYQGRAV